MPKRAWWGRSWWLKPFELAWASGGGGWVDKFMGDGMLAVFGAPDPLENHAHSAFTAATAMVREVKQISPLAMGVGVHSGPVVAGCLGTSGRLEFTVIGDTANVAARLEALTKTLGHPLLVSAATREQLGSWPLQSVGPRPHSGSSPGDRAIYGAVEILTRSGVSLYLGIEAIFNPSWHS